MVGARRRPEPQLRRVLGRRRLERHLRRRRTTAAPAPFSEPETQNIRELVSGRQVTTLITNHTFSGLVLRPPGIAAQGTTVDEPIYKALGDSMAAENGYSSQYGYQLYDTTGTTEDWSYNATGGLGFTFEIGHLGFHPPFAETVGGVERHDRLRHRRRQPRGVLHGAGEHGRRRPSTRCWRARRRPGRSCG